jgi:hypothetical protein
MFQALVKNQPHRREEVQLDKEIRELHREVREEKLMGLSQEI